MGNEAESAPARTRSRHIPESIPLIARIAWKSDQLQIDGLRPAALSVRLYRIGQLHTFAEIRQSRALHGGIMHENVLAAALWRDETIALRLIEELDSTSLALVHGKVTPSFPSRWFPAAGVSRRTGRWSKLLRRKVKQRCAPVRRKQS